MAKFVGIVTLICALPVLWAAATKEYPLTVNGLETDAVVLKADGTQTTTTCTTGPSKDEIDCGIKADFGSHTELVSYATASDGKSYLLSCLLGEVGKRRSLFEGQRPANASVATMAGCEVYPGAYKGRWYKGHLKLLFQKDGSSWESTFEVLNSAAIPTNHFE